MEKRLDIIRVATAILDAIEAIKAEGQRSFDLIKAKAETAAAYDMMRGIGTATHKSAGESVTTIKPIVDGEASEQLAAKIVAEETIKAHYCRMENLRSQLNGLQSVNKYLDHLPK